MQVPQGVGEGLARITFSFPGWPQRPVTPKTVELALKPATPAVASVVTNQQPVPSSNTGSGGWLVYGGVGAAGFLVVMLLLLRIQRADASAKRR